MGKENKSYRIRTNVNQDSVVNFSIDNTTEQLEILSLKISQENTYRLMGSNTGIVAGRVLANGGFGVPNVKVSVFIAYEDTDNIEQRVLYTYTGTTDRNSDGVRYNLLPDNVDDECHQNIGTFPSKRVLLDNNNWIDIFDKYYKFTTRTNESGDYMIYGVPTGNQTIHMDVDMSDIGVLSQKPRDMIYNGYNGNMFESPTKFKVDTNIDSLAQVRTQDQAVYVYPFWGDTTDSNLNASITRCDMNINYKFEPTCIFMGSVISDTGENAMSKNCVGAKNQGKMSDMITGEGKIEMIRKTPNGQVEQFSVNGDNNINSDGVWCYQIPMNLDYVMHDEFGKMVMTDNPNVGIPTRARVRFRLSMAESPSDAIARKRARFLIPNNPRLVEEDYPDYCETKEIDYEFGTKTKDENFRDLFWNNVYTVKSYIPRLQKTKLPNSMRHLGIKTVNHSGGHNPMPFNNLGIKFNFVYMFLCVLVKVLVRFIGAINSILTFISWIILQIGKFFYHAAKAVNISIAGAHPLDGLAKIFCKYKGHGVRDKDDITADEYVVKVWEDMQNGKDVCGGIATWFMRIFLGIGCGIELNGLCETDEGESINISPGTNDNVRDFLKKKNIMICNDRVDILYNCIENQLAQDNEVTRFNFYNDWINGVVYLPLWYRKIKKRRNGTVKKDIWCSTDNTIVKTRKHKKNMKLYNTNVPKRIVSKGGDKSMGIIKPLVNNEDTVIAKANNETGSEDLSFTKKNDENCYGYQCHRFSRTFFNVYKGFVFEKTTMLGDKVYYYKPCDYDPSTGNSDLVTLFATDLVLLGSLNDCDIHGIPQFFKTLESTTYNMPPDLMSEYYDYTNETNQNGNDEQDAQEIDLGSKITEYTGADWGNLGADQSNYNKSLITILGSSYAVDANENQYDNGGLFYGLTCFDSYTKPKSCINLSRICELGVSLDEMDEIPSSNEGSTDNDTDTLTPDGFISYDEIYNPDYRSMFATLNGNFLRTTLNPETGLLEYDFNYLYIDNFDGSLNQLMKAKTVNGYTEKSDFKEKANYINNYNLELSSDSYLNFRYGNYVKRNGNKIYYYENNNTAGHAGFGNVLGPSINAKNRQPRYENSFYFYFGLNEGKTAIDKFNTEFFSDCSNKFAADVPYDLTYQGNSWCPINSEDGFIAFNMNIEPPYKVTFTNKENNNVYFQDNIDSEKFIFCDPEYLPEGYEKYTIYTLNAKIADDIDNSTNEVHNIPNGTYTIEIIDGYDNQYNDNITFEANRIGFMCDVNPFNRKNNELMEKFKDEDELLSTTYADIANYARFVDDNMVIDMDALTYSLFNVGYIIKEDEVYYTKDNFGVFHQSIASENITVTLGDEYYYKHEPRLDRDIRGFIALSEITEDDFRIDFEPIDKDFFGSNYIGTSVIVHVTYSIYPEPIIPFGETYYINDNGKYQPMVAQDDIINDWVSYFKADISVTENRGNSTYGKYKVNYVITNGTIYYERTGTGTPDDPYVYNEITASQDITVQAVDEYYYKVDICGYLGHIIYNGVITYYFGVPYGGQKYRITATQLCERDTEPIWDDSKNVTIINVIVYEDEFKMFINGIDYDIIQKFKTGWNEVKLTNGEFRDINGDYSEFIEQSLYGWDDILNIGRYNGDHKLTKIDYMRNVSDLNKVLAICKVLNSNYEGNATGDDNGETPYSWSGIYCYNAPSDNPVYYYKGTVDKLTYSYTIINPLYDSDGTPVTTMVHGNTYYVDEEHTIEAEANVDYIEEINYEQIEVTRFDSKIIYQEYSDDDYLYDGNTYRYEYPFIQGEYRDGVVGGYPDGIKVNMFRRTLRIRDNVTLYDYDGNIVTSSEILPEVDYYTDNSHQTLANEGSEYVIYSPVISYQLENPLYTAEFKDNNNIVLVTEDNDGALTYRTEDNVEYSDLECLTFYDYRNIIDNINNVIDERNEFVREVAGTFRINEGETALTITTQTKAKPVKYLVAGSSEISVIEKMYDYRPTDKKMGKTIMPLEFNSMSDINNTKFAAASSVKNVSDGYVVDKNLETPNITFGLPTLTNDYVFVQYEDDDDINNGDVYYSEDIIACKEGDIIKPRAEYYKYDTSTRKKEYYKYYENGDDEIIVDASGVGVYFYITGEKVKQTATIANDSGFLPLTMFSNNSNNSSTSKTVGEFVKYAHTTSRIYKLSNTEKHFLPYYINKYKHPYYVSVMNDNDSTIPYGDNLANFADLGDDKDLMTTFGVHFYNKPLKSDFKMALAFINNIPVYPKYMVGGDSYIGIAYGLSSYPYNISKLEYNETEYLDEGTVVYATVDNDEPNDILLLNKYYMHEVKYNPQKQFEYDETGYNASIDETYVKFKVGDTVKVGDTYYTREIKIQPSGGAPFIKRVIEYVNNTLSYTKYDANVELVPGTTYYVLTEDGEYIETTGEKYNPNDVIRSTETYYLYNSETNPQYTLQTAGDANIRVPSPNREFYDSDMQKYPVGSTIHIGSKYYLYDPTTDTYEENTAITNILVQFNSIYFKKVVVPSPNNTYYKLEDITIASGVNWYHRKETIREIKENILIENGLVTLGTPGVKCGKYGDGTILTSGDWYYTLNETVVDHVITKNIVTTRIVFGHDIQDNNHIFVKYEIGTEISAGTIYYTPSLNNQYEFEAHTAPLGGIEVGVRDNFYYIMTQPQDLYSIDTNGVNLYDCDLINSEDNLDYYVYKGDIVYYTNKYEMYPENFIIHKDEQYYCYKKNFGSFRYVLEKANDDIIVHNDEPPFDDNDKQYYKFTPQSYNRMVINDNKKLSDYITSSFGGVYYVNKRSDESTNKCILVDRLCDEYDGATWSSNIRGNYGYPISIDCLKDNESIVRGWCVKQNGSDIKDITYNNYGEYRYYNFGNYTYTINLNKRDTECAAEPVYEVIGNGTYEQTTSTEIDSYVMIESGRRIPIGKAYYYNPSNAPQPDVNSFIKKYTTKETGVIIVFEDNKYYYGVTMGTYAPEGDNYEPYSKYRGVYCCSTGLNQYEYYPFYGEVLSIEEMTKDWQPVNVFMPGFLSGYFYNGIPRSDEDKSNIKATLNGNEIDLYTPTTNNEDVYKNINVRRLIYTKNDYYSTDYPATYGVFNEFESDGGLDYQYTEVPLVDDEIVYTDGYGNDYRKMISGTLSVVFDNPVLTYFNLGQAKDYVRKNLDYEDYITSKTFYTSDDGYVQHQTLYYVYDLEKTEYPLLYYNTDSAIGFTTKLRYNKEQDRFYFTEMPDILKDIEHSGYISKSKSTDFNVWAYLRKKYNQPDDVFVAADKNKAIPEHYEAGPLPIDLYRPKDKFFVIACVDNIYTISPVIETQRFRVILNYNGFDNRNGSAIYITCRDSRKRTTEASASRGIHYIEDMYYMLYYRFIIHVASFDYDTNNNGSANAKYSSDAYTQVCSVSEGTAEHCYIKVIDKDVEPGQEDYVYWASAIKVDLSSIGSETMDDNGQIYDWLQLIIEDISGGMRVCAKQTSGDDPSKGVTVVEFEDYDAMYEDYNPTPTNNTIIAP